MGDPVKQLVVTINRLCYCVTAGCGVAVYVEDYREQDLRDSGKQFYCINGHSMSWSETKTMRLEKELTIKQRALESAQANAKWHQERREEEALNAAHSKRVAAVYRGKHTQLKKRVACGVCPCCKRSFTALRRHMATKHPEWTGQELA